MNIDLSGNIPKWLWKNLVPRSGQATSVQGELLRAVERLRWEAQTNGNQNWDEGFEKLLRFLKVTLLEESRLPTELRAEIETELKRLADYERPVAEEGPYDRITVGIAEFCRLHPQVIDRTLDPTLLR